MHGIKAALWRLVCHLAYWSGIVPLWAKALAWRSRPTWTVVTYHRIGSPEWNGGPDLVDLGRFRRQLRYLRDHYEVLTVREVLERLRSGKVGSRPLLSITFDDGYQDNVTTALPIMRQEGCRATLYVTLEAVRKGLAPWPHRLAVDLLALARRGPVLSSAEATSIPGVLQAFLAGGDCEEVGHAARIRSVVERVKALSEPERRDVCEVASRLSGGLGRAAAEMVGREGLLEWLRAGMEIGSHTSHHRILSRLSGEERLRELLESRQELEQLVQAPVHHLAYPNGRPGDWDEETARQARIVGYRSAATTVEGINVGDFDPFCIKRISVGNDSLPVFATRVSGLFAHLRSRVRRRSLGARRKRRLRIAFIGGRGVGSAYSGIERYYEEVGARLVSQGHQVVAYCRPHFSPRVALFRGIQVRLIPTVRSKHLETLVHTLLATIDVCFRKVDVVQFHALGSSPFAWIPRLAGKKSIVSVRGLDWQRAKWGPFARAFLRVCEWTSIVCPNATTVVSKTLQRHFRERFGLDVRYIPNGVGRQEASPPQEIRRWGLDHRSYLLYTGRLSPEKGLEGLIQAHDAVDSGCALVIAGGSSYSEGYMERLRRQAGPGVIFTGYQTGRVLEELYANARAFVLPSQMEGLSVALLEAMASGLPVVASDIAENRELVEECGGYLFRVNDTESLAQTLRTVVANREEARRVGLQARERVRERFDWDRVAQETARFYLDVMDRPAAQKTRAVAEAPFG